MVICALGPLAVAVPGEISGYLALYERFGGGVSWSDLIEPSAQLCEGGTPVHSHLAKALEVNSKLIVNEPTMRFVFRADVKHIVIMNVDLKLLSWN